MPWYKCYFPKSDKTKQKLLLRLGSCILAVIVGLWMAALMTTQAEASQPLQQYYIPSCYSLDIVLLVDQSSSMFNSDPNELRKYAIHRVIEWLGDNVLTNCPDAMYTIGIVSWGNTVVENMPFTVISPWNREQWNKQRELLEEKVVITDLGEGLNGPGLAFQLAKSMFDSASLRGLLPHKRAVIMITDGVFDIDNEQLIVQIEKDLPSKPSVLAAMNCLDLVTSLSDVVDSDASDAMANKCFSLNDVDASEIYQNIYIWNLWLPKIGDDITKQYLDMIAYRHGGDSIELLDNQDTSEKIEEMLTSLAGANNIGLDDAGSFYVEAYQDQLVLTFFKMAPDIPVTITHVLA